MRCLLTFSTGLWLLVADVAFGCEFDSECGADEFCNDNGQCIDRPSVGCSIPNCPADRRFCCYPEGGCNECCFDSHCGFGMSCNDNRNCVTCFSGETTIQVLDKGTVFMKDLAIGDMVLTSGYNKYERVYAFAHRDANIETEFLQIHVDNNKRNDRPLEISPEHLIYVQAENKKSILPVPSSSVCVGDSIVVTNYEPDKIQEAAMVTKIGRVRRRGIYAPLSKSGQLLVEGMLVSNYITAQSESPFVTLFGGALETPFTWHWVCHAFQVPHRMLCDSFQSWCDHQNVPRLQQVELMQHVSYWGSNQRIAVVKYVAFPLVMLFAFIMLGTFWIAENLFMEAWLLVCAAIGWLAWNKAKNTDSKSNLRNFFTVF